MKPNQVLEQLESIRSQTLQYLEPLTNEQLNKKPKTGKGEEAWSLGEVFMHVAIDEIYVREMITKPLIEGVQPPEAVHFLPPPPPYGMSKDVIQHWLERARQGTKRLIAAWPASADLTKNHAGGLELMNGLEWLAAYGSHEAFHHRQIRDLLGE